MSVYTEDIKATENIPKNWKKEKDFFTSNELISAYESGKKAGMDFQQKVMQEKYFANLELAVKSAEAFYDFFKDLGVSPDARLRINNIASFDFAFLLDEETFNSDTLDLAYEHAQDLRTKLSTDTFSIYFYLFPKTKKLDLNRMISDGFIHYYEPKSSTATTP